MTTIELKDLTVRFGDFTAVRSVSLTIGENEVVGLVGESGSGKSTLARTIMGLTPVSGGDILVDGRSILDRHGVASPPRAIQMIFQDPRSALDPRFTVMQVVAEAMASRGGRSRHDRVLELLDQVVLDRSVATARPGRLSGGQQQRVAIARAFAAQPRMILADEVTASLDVSVQAVVLNVLRSMGQDSGLGMLFVSHNLAVVRYMADRTAVMRNGELVELDDTDQLVAAPKHPYTRTLLDAVPRIGQKLDVSREVSKNLGQLYRRA